MKYEIRFIVELEGGVILPINVEKDIPLELPSGFQLVVFERLSHSSGEPTGYRFFALKPGKYKIDGERVVINDNPVKVSTLDSNSDVLYPLPKGSMEYKNHQWVPSSGVDYNY